MTSFWEWKIHFKIWKWEWKIICFWVSFPTHPNRQILGHCSIDPMAWFNWPSHRGQLKRQKIYFMKLILVSKYAWNLISLCLQESQNTIVFRCVVHFSIWQSGLAAHANMQKVVHLAPLSPTDLTSCCLRRRCRCLVQRRISRIRAVLTTTRPTTPHPTPGGRGGNEVVLIFWKCVASSKALRLRYDAAKYKHKWNIHILVTEFQIKR